MSSVPLNDDSHLAYTQEIRRRIVNSLTEQGAKIPDDPKVLAQLLTTLKDTDKVTLTLKRFDAEKENSEADRQALEMFQKLAMMNGSKDQLRRSEPAAENAGPDFNPNDIPDFPTVDGELRRENDSTDYERLMAEQNARLQQKLTGTP